MLTVTDELLLSQYWEYAHIQANRWIRSTFVTILWICLCTGQHMDKLLLSQCWEYAYNYTGWQIKTNYKRVILRHKLLSKLCLAVWGFPAHFPGNMNTNTCIIKNENEFGFLGRFSPNPEDLGENWKFLPLRLVKWSILYTALAYLGEKVVLFETVCNCCIGHCILKRHQVDQCIDICWNLPLGPGYIPPAAGMQGKLMF